MRYEGYAWSDVGNIKEVNQDSVLLITGESPGGERAMPGLSL